jgi:hypothetical protein
MKFVNTLILATVSATCLFAGIVPTSFESTIKLEVSGETGAAMKSGLEFDCLLTEFYKDGDKIAWRIYMYKKGDETRLTQKRPQSEYIYDGEKSIRVIRDTDPDQDFVEIYPGFQSWLVGRYANPFNLPYFFLSDATDVALSESIDYELRDIDSRIEAAGSLSKLLKEKVIEQGGPVFKGNRAQSGHEINYGVAISSKDNIPVISKVVYKLSAGAQNIEQIWEFPSYSSFQGAYLYPSEMKVSGTAEGGNVTQRAQIVVQPLSAGNREVFNFNLGGIKRIIDIQSGLTLDASNKTETVHQAPINAR